MAARSITAYHRRTDHAHNAMKDGRCHREPEQMPPLFRRQRESRRYTRLGRSGPGTPGDWLSLISMHGCWAARQHSTALRWKIDFSRAAICFALIYAAEEHSSRVVKNLLDTEGAVNCAFHYGGGGVHGGLISCPPSTHF